MSKLSITKRQNFVVFTTYLVHAVTFAQVLYALVWCDDIQKEHILALCHRKMSVMPLVADSGCGKGLQLCMTEDQSSKKEL